MGDLLSLNDWANDVAGRYVDDDGAYGGQCWDSFADYCRRVLGIRPINTWGGTWAGWAYAIWDQYHVNGAALVFDRIPADQPAQPGDVAIWTDQFWQYPASHIAVVLADAGPSLWCMSQNSSPPQPWLPGYHPLASGPNQRQKLTKAGLAGYLRRKTVQTVATPIKPKEWDEMASKDEIKAAYREVLAEPAVLDRIALAVLKRPCFLVDPTGTSHEVTGTTTLAKKVNYFAHNDAQMMRLLESMANQLGLLVPPAIEAPEPAELADATPAAVEA